MRSRINALPSVFLLVLFVITSSMTSEVPVTESYSIIIGLNPAFQKRFILPPETQSLISGNVHRASEIQQGVGGKGQDVFTSLSCLSTTDAATEIDPTITTAPSASTASESPPPPPTDAVKRGPIKLAQFLGSGAAGDTVASLLSNLRTDRRLSSVDDISLTVRTRAPLRTCTTVVGADAATELVEPSGAISEGEVSRLCEALDRCFDGDGGGGGRGGGDDAGGSAPVGSVCIMGSMPPGCPPDLYATLYEKIASRRRRGGSGGDLICLVDSVVGLGHLLDAMARQKGAVEGRNNMLKINLAELRKLAGVRGDGDHDNVDCPTIDGIGSVVEGLYETYPSVRDALSYVAITNGRHPSYLVAVGNSAGRAGDDGGDGETDKIYEIKIPVLGGADTCDEGRREGGATALYPIGAGDTVAAGTLASWQYLVQQQDRCGGMCEEEWLDERVQRALVAKETDDFVVKAFAFGLACGSASCLQQENSVFTIDNAIQLFDGMDMPQPYLMKTA